MPPGTTSSRTCSQPRTKEGKWVSCAYRNHEKGGIEADHTGALEYKHVWGLRHDGLLFSSGWHT